MEYFYIILLFFIALGYCYDYKKCVSARTFWMIFMWGVLVCVAAFRYRMGVDSVFYEYEYPEMPDLSQLADYKWGDSRYQPLYIIFTAFCRSLSSDFFYFQLFHALYVNTIVFWFFNKYTQHSFTGLTLYFLMLFLPFNMEVLRESLAVATFLLAWPMFKEGKWVWYYLICSVSLCFHLSAILTFLFPIFWLPGIRSLFVLGKRTIFICLLLFIIGFIVQKQFFDFLKVLSITDGFKERAEAYKGDELGGAALNINGAIGYLLRYAIYPVIAIYFIKKNKNRTSNRSKNKKEQQTLEQEEYMSMWNAYVACAALLITIFHRYNNYLAPFTYLIIADWAFSSLRVGQRVWRYKYYVWVIIFIPLFFMNIYSNIYGALNKSGTLKQGMLYGPYKSRLDPQEDKDREKAFRYINPWRKF